jgi:hypothetical protein
VPPTGAALGRTRGKWVGEGDFASMMSYKETRQEKEMVEKSTALFF